VSCHLGVVKVVEAPLPASCARIRYSGKRKMNPNTLFTY